MLSRLKRFIPRGESTLETELQFYRMHKNEWLLSHLGEFAVIGGTTVAGFYPDYEVAFQAGFRKFGARDFLIKQIYSQEPVYFIY
jgi:hypothetical protein